MATYIVNITEHIPGQESVSHYVRRVEMPDVTAVITRLDTALNVKARAPRSDKGRQRTTAE